MIILKGSVKGEAKGGGKGMGFHGDCFTCGKPGHTSRECWAKGGGKGGKGGGYVPASGKGSVRVLEHFWPSQVQSLSTLRTRETPLKNQFEALGGRDEDEVEGDTDPE